MSPSPHPLPARGERSAEGTRRSADLLVSRGRARSRLDTRGKLLLDTTPRESANVSSSSRAWARQPASRAPLRAARGRHAEWRWLAATIGGSCRTPLEETPRHALVLTSARGVGGCSAARGGSGVGGCARACRVRMRVAARAGILPPAAQGRCESRSPRPSTPLRRRGRPRDCKGAPCHRAHGALCARARACSAGRAPPWTARRAASSPSSSLRVRAAILDTRVV